MPDRKTTEQFIAEAKAIHGNKYNYSLAIYTKSIEKIKVLCPIHGIFEPVAATHLQGVACRGCSVDRDVGRKTQGGDGVLARFADAHGTRYDYSKTVYVAATKKVEIICRQHGVFWQAPNRHYSGNGCQSCARIGSGRNQSRINYQKQLDGTNKTRSRKMLGVFVEQCRQVHGNRYDYCQVDYETTHTPVIIVCPDHGPFRQRPAKHLSGRGCSRCGRQTSKVSSQWLDSLEVPVREYRLPERRLRVVDGYDPATKTVYQFHGDFFHGNPKLYSPNETNPLTKDTFGEAYARTCRLDDEIRTLGYNLVVMWEADYLTSS